MTLHFSGTPAYPRDFDVDQSRKSSRAATRIPITSTISIKDRVELAHERAVDARVVVAGVVVERRNGLHVVFGQLPVEHGRVLRKALGLHMAEEGGRQSLIQSVGI